MNSHRGILYGLGLFALLFVLGCNAADVPELAYVEGTVTMDGKPLEGALVTFNSVSGGRPSYGRTDESGWYEVIYMDGVEGALPGDHVVWISTFREGNGDSEDPEERKSRKEEVPAQYNINASDNPEMTRTVKAGEDNVINFELKSEGEIIELDDSQGGY